MISTDAHSSQRRPTNSERGLTLVEVIFALAILAFMVSVNYKILIGVIASRQLIDDRREGMYIANSVLTRLSRELQLATKRPILPACGSAAATPGGSGPAGSAGPPAQYFLAESGLEGTTLTFLAKHGGQHVPDGTTHSGVVQLTYRVAEDPDQKGAKVPGLLLIRDEVSTAPPLAASCKRALHFPITNNLISLTFRFFDARTKEWSDAWTGSQANHLPSIVEFTVALRSPSGKVQSYTSSVYLGSSSAI